MEYKKGLQRKCNTKMELDFKINYLLPLISHLNPKIRMLSEDDNVGREKEENEL